MDAGQGFHSDARLFHRDLINSMPLLLLFDYAAAFPSVAHTWILLILTFLKIPTGLFSLVKALYHRNLAYLGSQEGLVFMFVVLSGVLQGCPLSGSLFVIVIDPLLHMFKTQLENTGLATTRACADDIGVALRQLQSLPTLCLWFQCFTRVSGLPLGPARCIIVLTSIHNCLGGKHWCD